MMEADQGYSPQMFAPAGNPNNDFFRFRAESSDILEEMEHQLRGEVFVRQADGSGAWMKKFNQELTEEGINDVLNLVYTVAMNKCVLYGCLEKDEIYNRCNQLWKEMAKYAVIKGPTVGMIRSNRDMIIKKVIYLCHSGLTRSMNGREANQTSAAISKIEHQIKEDKVGRGPLSSLGNKLRGGL